MRVRSAPKARGVRALPIRTAHLQTVAHSSLGESNGDPRSIYLDEALYLARKSQIECVRTARTVFRSRRKRMNGASRRGERRRARQTVKGRGRCRSRSYVAEKGSGIASRAPSLITRR